MYIEPAVFVGTLQAFTFIMTSKTCVLVLGGFVVSFKYQNVFSAMYPVNNQLSIQTFVCRHHLPLAWARGHRTPLASIVFFVEVNAKMLRFQRAPSRTPKQHFPHLQKQTACCTSHSGCVQTVEEQWKRRRGTLP